MVKFDFDQLKSFLKAKPKIMENKKIKYKFGEKKVRKMIHLKSRIGQYIWIYGFKFAHISKLSFPMSVEKSTFNNKYTIHSHKPFLAGKYSLEAI